MGSSHERENLTPPFRRCRKGEFRPERFRGLRNCELREVDSRPLTRKKRGTYNFQLFASLSPAAQGVLSSALWRDQMTDWVGIAGLVVGIGGTGYAVWSDVKRRGERHWVHVALVNLKPSIQGPNRADVIRAIDNTLEFLKPPHRK
jgi:hypothetical protein